MSARLTAKLFCLLISLLFINSKVLAAPIAYSADGTNLISIDLADGSSTSIGALGSSGDTEAMAVDPTSGILYLATDGGSLYTVDTTTGAATLVGSLGVSYGNGGMSFDQNGVGYLVTSGGLFTFNKATGAAALVGDGDYNNADIVEGLSSGAFVGTTLFAGPDNSTASNLYSIDLTTGDATIVGALGVTTGSQTGLTFDSASNLLYMLNEADSSVYAINYDTGAATFVATYSGNFESLALANPGNPAAILTTVTPVPTLPLIALGILGGLAGLLGVRQLSKVA